jgi:hypothetical protein
MMLDHAFQSVSRVTFHVGVDNLRSRTAMERLGGVPIGQETVVHHGEQANPNVIYEIDREVDARSAGTQGVVNRHGQVGTTPNTVNGRLAPFAWDASGIQAARLERARLHRSNSRAIRAAAEILCGRSSARDRIRQRR